MATEHSRPDRLWLVATLPAATTPLRIYLDVSAPQNLLSSDAARPPPEVVTDLWVQDAEAADLKPATGGGLRVSRGLLWSLLDPCRAAALGRLEVSDRLTAERRLRAEGRHLWQRLHWWSELPADWRARSHDLLARYEPALDRLWTLLEDLASHVQSDPYAGWPADGADAHIVRGTDARESVPLAEGAKITAAAESLPGEPSALAAWLQDEAGFGPLYGDQFQPRREQADMAEAVSRALAERRPLLIEAGTGVGKTVAYLLPILQAVRGHEVRAVISTHTRALQIQILNHDLPLLAPLFPGLRARLLMGRGNYLCRRRRLEFLDRPLDSFAAACASITFQLWLAATRNGLREELADHPILDDDIAALFDSSDPCSAAICYEGDECFVQRARRRAREADLLVVNHALLMHDLAGAHSLIGEYELLVVDEAHSLPQVALDSHAVKCDHSRLIVIEDILGPVRQGREPPPLLQELQERLSALGGTGITMAAALDDLGRTIGACLRTYRTWWSALGRSFDARLTEDYRPAGRVRVYDKAEAFGPVRPATQKLLKSAAAASSAYAKVGQHIEQLPELPAGTEEKLAALAQVGSLLVDLQQDVRFLTSGSEEDWVTWFEPAAQSGVRTLGATLLESGGLLRDYWLEAQLRPVMTSATLAVGEDFGHMLGELGLTRLQPTTRTDLVASPFQYDRQAMILVPAEFPAPDHAEFGSAIALHLRALQRRVPRKMLVLFTSYQLLHKVASELRNDADDVVDLFAPDTRSIAAPETSVVLAQAQGGPTGGLLSRFRRAEKALLLGTTTFWEGVDFPGADLEVLVVTKLPFMVPNDPWVEARCGKIQAAGEDPFTSFMVRDAVLRLRQGVGRLIRRSSDRGVIVLLDTRLHGKPYGITFLNALPRSPQLFQGAEDLAQRVVDFFAPESGAASA